MRATANVVITLLVAFNLVAASAMPAKRCACCQPARQAQKAEVSAKCCGPAESIAAPVRPCCQMSAAGESSPATLNTAIRTSHEQTLTAYVSGPAERPFIPAAPERAPHSFGTFKSPPVYKLTSAYLC